MSRNLSQRLRTPQRHGMKNKSKYCIFEMFLVWYRLHKRNKKCINNVGKILWSSWPWIFYAHNLHCVLAVFVRITSPPIRTQIISDNSYLSFSFLEVFVLVVMSRCYTVGGSRCQKSVTIFFIVLWNVICIDDIIVLCCCVKCNIWMVDSG